MIARDSKGFFGGRVTEIHTPSFKCVVSTGKEGVFGPMVTVIIDGEGTAEDRERGLCGKISYAPGLGKAEILDQHETIVQRIDEGGRKGVPLGVALQDVIDYLKEKGLAVETVNIARWGAGKDGEI